MSYFPTLRIPTLCVQSLCRSALESAQTGIPSQLGRSSFGLGPEFFKVWLLKISLVLFSPLILKNVFVKNAILTGLLSNFLRSPQNLNARKAEFLVGLSNLKSAASSVAKKIDEIKGAIGAGVTVTPSKLSGSGM